MDARSWSFVAASCLGKQAFSTPQLASKVLRRRKKKRAKDKREGEVYRCDVCRLFHIGRSVKSVHASTKRARSRTEEIGDDMV
jgi:uncharacterized protein YjhX (UPF0386 family)